MSDTPDKMNLDSEVWTFDNISTLNLDKSFIFVILKEFLINKAKDRKHFLNYFELWTLQDDGVHLFPKMCLETNSMKT